MSTYDVKAEAKDACRHVVDDCDGERCDVCRDFAHYLQRAFNAGLSRAEEVVREYLGHLDREDISPLVRVAVREAANRIAENRERTPALCAEMAPFAPYSSQAEKDEHVRASGSVGARFAVPREALEEIDAQVVAGMAAEPAPREPEKRPSLVEPTPPQREPAIGDIWAATPKGKRNGYKLGPYKLEGQGQGGYWSVELLASAGVFGSGLMPSERFTDGSLTLVSAASGTPGDAK